MNPSTKWTIAGWAALCVMGLGLLFGAPFWFVILASLVSVWCNGVSLGYSFALNAGRKYMHQLESLYPYHNDHDEEVNH